MALEAQMKAGHNINFIWRLLATGISYTIFGMGGVLLYFLYPVLRLLPLAESQRHAYGRKLIHWVFRSFIGLMHRLGIYTYEFHGAELLLEKGQLIVANHPTLIDVCFLLSRIPEANCIVRAGLIRNPFTRGSLKTADFIVNENPEQLMTDCADTLIKGHSLVVFPEGTRTKPNQPMSFKKGTANIALRAGVPIRPVTISCNPTMLQKGKKWHKIPKHRPHFVIRVQAPFEIKSYLNNVHSSNVNAKCLNQDLRLYIEKMLAEH